MEQLAINCKFFYVSIISKNNSQCRFFTVYIAASKHALAGLTEVLGSGRSAHAAWHCARSKPGQARPARYKSSSKLLGGRRRSSVFERERTRAAV